MSFPGDVEEHLRQRKYVESNVAAKLGEFANTLLISYDLDSPRNQVWLGDAQKKGRVTLERYISFRPRGQYRRGEYLKLVAINFLGDDLNHVRYQLFGPKRLLTKFRTLRELRPYLNDDEIVGATTGGEEYESFDAAAARFRWLIDQVCREIGENPFKPRVAKKSS